MLFNSYEFIFIFLPLVWLLYFLLKNPRHKLAVLALSSYFFYGYWNYKFIPLLLLSTVIDFFIAQGVARSTCAKRAKSLLLISLSLNLGMLGFFKYFNFFLDNINHLTNSGFGGWDIVLPVGISFYTFQSLSYTIDVYRGSQKPYDDFLAFSTYVSFFPQLIAGPIVRHTDLVPQFLNPLNFKAIDWSQFSYGLQRFILGLFKKVIIADTLGRSVDYGISNLAFFTSLEAWLIALGYTFQLYFDFSGYSDMAIGLGRLFGFKFPENFNSPYKSVSITDFWRRWHITLSSWLRDYLYISLGGNRVSRLRTYFNLFITMLLGGLWHGAGWVFIIWGAYHGIMLALEKRFQGLLKLPKALKIFLSFVLVNFGWVLFRSPDIKTATLWLSKLVSFSGGFYYKNIPSLYRDKFLITLVIAALISFGLENLSQKSISNYTRYKYIPAFVLMFIAVIFSLGAKSSFLYFQF